MIATAATTTTDLASLVRKRQALERRLVDGWKRIDAAIAEGRDVTGWEELWVSLLAEYEQVCDRIRRTAA